MYNCEICCTPSLPNASAKKITIFRQVKRFCPQRYLDKYDIPRVRDVERILQQVEKELKVCDTCHDGYRKGIPIDVLRSMHRPASPPKQQQSGGVPSTSAEPKSPTAPLAGASSKPSPSPKEKAPPLMLGAAKVDKVVAGVFQDRLRGKRHKEKKVKYANLKKKPKAQVAKQT